jgi:biopolymer transport protein ExbD
MKRHDHPQIELQIAPMIDVCFLLLFFYILTSKPMKQEADVSMSLPGTVSQEQSVEIPDEQRIRIDQNGQVILNDLPMDASLVSRISPAPVRNGSVAPRTPPSRKK